MKNILTFTDFDELPEKAKPRGMIEHILMGKLRK